jgi:hypothetical protein
VTGCCQPGTLLGELLFSKCVQCSRDDSAWLHAGTQVLAVPHMGSIINSWHRAGPTSPVRLALVILEIRSQYLFSQAGLSH